MATSELQAALFDRFTQPLEQAGLAERRRRLLVQARGRVLEVGAGTGANLPLLIERVGSEGQVCAVDYSKGMLAKARAKVAKAGWTNVELIEADARQRLTDYDPDAKWHVSVVDGVVTTSAHLADEREERLVDALLRTVPGAVRVHVHSARFAR